MFKTRLLKWQLICLLIISFFADSRVFAVENQNNVSADQNGIIVSEDNIDADPVVNSDIAVNPDVISNPPETSEINPEENVSSNCEPIKLLDGESSYSRDVVVNEVLPAPKDLFDKEFIEFYNQGEEAVDLVNWCIDDIEGGSSPILIDSNKFPDIPGLAETPETPSFIIYPHKFFVLELVNIFNNTGDSARLINPDKELVSEIAYENAKTDQSWSRFEDGWKWTTPSPDALNIAPTVEDETVIEQNVEIVKGLTDGTEVLTRGTVSVLPDTLSTQYFYIEDQSAGIQIYSYYKNFLALSEGDLITVHGELSTVSGERRIKISSLDDIKIIASGSVLSPLDITLDKVGDLYLGRYIKVNGVVKSTSGKEFVLDGNREIKVSIKDGTNIKKPRMEKGDKVVVAGILAKYNETFRILPIRENDVKIVTSDELPLSGPDMLIYLDINLIFYLVFIVWNIFLKVKMKRSKSPKVLPVIVSPAIFLLCLETWVVEKQHSQKGLPRVLVW